MNFIDSEDKMLTIKDICAVIISYNCNETIHNNIEAILKQVDKLLIVDNGSSNRTLLILSKYNSYEKIDIIYNNENMGIAFALNQGLKYAKVNNYKLLLTMDQDSKLHMNSVELMLNVLNTNSSIVSVGPNYNKINRVNESVNYKFVDYLITSGNLSYVDISTEVGGYNNDLFIDGVDFDFSLSFRTKNYKIALVYDAFMDHNLGELEVKKFLFFKYQIRTHSPLRHYYMYRNHYYILRKYVKTMPFFCLKKEINSLIYLLKLLILHPNKKNNIIMIMRGIIDAFKHRYGKYSVKR